MILKEFKIIANTNLSKKSLIVGFWMVQLTLTCIHRYKFKELGNNWNTSFGQMSGLSEGGKDGGQVKARVSLLVS